MCKNSWSKQALDFQMPRLLSSVGILDSLWEGPHCHLVVDRAQQALLNNSQVGITDNVLSDEYKLAS